MISRKIIYWTLMVSGVLVFLVGICFVYMYVNGAIIERLGEPDQSLLFWYLPILFIGLAGLVLGSGISILALGRFKKISPTATSKNKRPKVL